MRTRCASMLLAVLLLACLCAVRVSADYELASLTQTAYGWEADLTVSTPAPYGRSIPHLHLSVWFETAARLRIALRDANASRWEVPAQYRHVDSTRPPRTAPPSALYQFRLGNATLGGHFSFQVVRAATGRVLFDTAIGALHYSPQYIEFSTALPSDANLYGLGERIVPLRLAQADYVIWTTDWANPTLKNLYGHHPVYQRVEADGLTHAVVLYNSNMMDVQLMDDRLRYRVIGGIVDLYVMLGPTPLDVAEQYTAVVGRPFMPPLWSIGWHQCRCFYESANRTLAVVMNYTKFDMPLDAIWNDIDWMRDYVFGTYNDELGSGGYTLRDVKALNTYVRSHQQKRVLIVDPNIPALLADKNNQPYLPYVEGKAAGIFVRHPANDSLLYGKQWPAVSVAWPDWTHPGVVDWWLAQYQRFGELAGQMDGVWLDMNEPSAFCPAEISASCQGVNDTTRVVDPAAVPHARVSSPTDIPYPPYQPGAQWQRMEDKSFNISSHHAIGQHYDVKEMYGYTEQIAAARVMERLHNQRAFSLSRGTFIGSGAHGAHWLGDNQSTWADLVSSIAEVLAMGIYGVVNVGADICGFGGETTAEMCVRWIQFGSLYPFARSHNAGQRDQEPYQFDDVVNDMNRNSLKLRYSLLPYLYQQFVVSHQVGAPIWRALYMEWPTDSATWAIDRQFMLGSALLGIPAVEQGATSVQGYVPNGDWFDFLSFKRVARASTAADAAGGWLNFSAPISSNATIPLLHRGGCVVARQQPRAQTADTWLTDFTLHVALDGAGTSEGDITLDDGVSLGGIDRGDYHRIEHRAALNLSGSAVVGYVEQRVPLSKCAYNISGQYVELVAVLGLDLKAVSQAGQPTLTVAGKPVSLSKVTWTVVNGALVMDARNTNLLPIAQPWRISFAGQRRDAVQME